MTTQQLRSALTVTAITWFAWAVFFLLLYGLSVWTGANGDRHLWLAGFILSAVVMNLYLLRRSHLL